MQIDIKDGYAHYECGCSFKVLDNGPPVRLDIKSVLSNPPLDCNRTWDLISDGNTKGVFQLETRFGQQYAKKLKPTNINHLSALSAILRPGCLANLIDGKSVTDHFIDRKNGVEEIEYFHPDLEPILRDTFGLMVYQESAMKIAQHFAGFDLQQADVLRKAIGKKKADVMAEIKKEFITGCEKTGIVDAGRAEELFGWIEKSQRYSFNKSHARCYADNSYLSAYLKAHFPVSFFTSYLYFAKDKQNPLDEVKELVSNAKVMDVGIYPPDFRNSHGHFKRLSNQGGSRGYNTLDDKIYFGFLDIRGVGESAMTKINSAIYQAEMATGKNRKDWIWVEFLMFFSQNINTTAINGLIESGSLDYFGISRTKMLFEFEQYSNLTKKEQAWMIQHLQDDDTNDIEDLLVRALDNQKVEEAKKRSEKGAKCFANKNRVIKAKGLLDLVRNPPYSMNDSPDWIARIEEAKLGVSLTASTLDSCKDISQANCTIIDFIKHKENNSGIFMACQIEDIKPHTPRNRDKEMAFLIIKDGDCSLDCVAFFEDWEKIKRSGVCYKDNKILITGDRSRNSDSFIVKNMWQLT